MECPICLCDINCEYAMINNIAESGRYHIDCLKGWISRSKCGIMTQYPIESYIMFNDNKSDTIIKIDMLDDISVFINNIRSDYQNLRYEYDESDDNTDDHYDDSIEHLTWFQFIFCCAY